MDTAVLAGGALSAAATAYALLATLATTRARHARSPALGTAAAQNSAIDAPASVRVPSMPSDALVAAHPVTVLKPLCGAEPRLYENLATFCQQSHPSYQLVFGVRDANDPAVTVVRRLQADYPQRDIALAIDPATHGSNPKVSNLLNMMPHARHDWLVLADSDIAVPNDYLVRVTAPLADVKTGVVTCLYKGRAAAKGWPQLGVQFIDDWFAPSVHVAHAGGSRSFAFGATIALRRDALNAIGGFSALKDRLADDYWLGELTRQQGLTTVLSDVVVTTDVTEKTLKDLWRHELRWMRTIRSLNPAGFAFTFITFTWPMLLLGLAIAPGQTGWALLLAGAIVRSWQAGSFSAALRAPLRDALLLAEWAAALSGSRVRWRQQTLSVHDAQPLPERSQ
ncbi:bacteriohopanetetrol glucosamine biosynthesis glycosyltransferase HpnI [Pseudoduganella sp. RAF53_2]|uniref:bacteriohopanetetrol glucosamine biosynthesis glycosyltransferase HpnI n=1 Tax=unclassified Pseudoduganella TaxID=2637179 RepID=UPI003F9E8A1F